ncbi:auxin-induced in root cultures protein 12 [Cynara cardunculus var. scolymus]|uniref:DOMON domain-containing protein n=1 Tax=Cynara cardunculus var. scolymus TaxID=59895 RepID=A0A103Y769_CYNCS|nr:auxin-induced in root cultures protein 12 [Cynara cardunculus var. scolymus]KVI03784.1 DOMON domain-containing protein [Cynara cardunculus var. scolymus]
MAFLHRQSPFCVFVIALTFLVLLTSPASSLDCSSQKFANNLYANCTDLPTLKSSLHWIYISKTSSLSIAFIAPPPKPDGWIAWAINPTQTGMAGSQALIAFKDANGSMTVKKYNISSYSSIVEGEISFEVPESRAEYSGGSMKIFATVKLPETMTEVNHVWQVGGLVTEGRPTKHEFQPANLKAVGKLHLKLAEKEQNNSTTAGSPIVSPISSPSPSTSSASCNTKMYVYFMLIIGALISN